MEINKDELLNTINSLNTKKEELETIYREIEEKCKVLDGTDDVWKSDTQKIIFSYYENIRKEFPDVVLKFQDFSNFLSKTLENYENYDNGVNSDVDTDLEDLSID